MAEVITGVGCDAGGAPLEAELGVVREALKNTAEQLEASNQELKAAAAAAARLATFPERNPNPIVEAEPDGRVRYLNPAARGLFPDLAERGGAHPWLADLPGLAKTIARTGANQVVREVSVDGETYEQVVFRDAQTGGIRIYGRDITERKRAENALRESEEFLRHHVENSPLAVIEWDSNFVVRRWAGEATAIFGWSAAETVGRPIMDLRLIYEDDLPTVQATMARLTGGAERHLVVTNRNLTKDGRVIHCTWYNTVLPGAAGQMKSVMSQVLEITERKRTDEEREATVEFLHLVNESRSETDLVRGATAFFQRRSGCEAAGIRLRQRHDYPYFETRGFSREFVERENRLCARDEAGDPLLDGAGNPVLECMCGAVIRGQFDPAKPFFTRRGSFWTNATSRLLADATEAGQARTRNRCNGEGYESVALIGLNVGDERLGLLQLNDRRAGRFNAESLALWERLADYLAVALAKFRADAELQRRGEVLNGINAIFRTVFSGVTEEQLGQACLTVATAVTGGAFGFIGEIGPDGLLHDIAISGAGWERCSLSETAGHRRIPNNFQIRGLYGRVLIDGKGFFTNEPATHPDSVGTPPGHPALTSFLGVPLLRDGRTSGLIAMGNREGGFRQEELESLEVLASAIGEAVYRHRTERALILSEERLERAQAIAHLGSWDLDLVDNVLVWSDETYRIIGLSPREGGASYESFLAAVHPDDRAAVDAAYRESVRTGQDAYEIEHRIIRPATGEVRVVHERCAHFRDGSGRVVRSVGMVQDITERQLVEEAMRRQAEELLERNQELTRFNTAAVGRELRMIELKKAVNELLEKAGRPPRFPLDFEKES